MRETVLAARHALPGEASLPTQPRAKWRAKWRARARPEIPARKAERRDELGASTSHAAGKNRAKGCAQALALALAKNTDDGLRTAICTASHKHTTHFRNRAQRPGDGQPGHREPG
jgi:hypothetical protein